MNKTNSFVKYFKLINKSINNLLERNLNKLKFNNLINIARSNKLILTFVAVFILSISYLLLPNFYKKNEISTELKKELSNKFNLDFNFYDSLDYNFFPRPHFTSNKSTIQFEQTKISNIKKIKIYVSLKNLYSLKNIKVNDVVLENANFELNKFNYNFFTKLLDNNFSASNLKIKNSNVFFHNYEKEVLFINKIKSMEYYYDENQFKNVLYSTNEVFNIPYNLEISNNKKEKKLFSKLNLILLKLQFENEIDYKNDIKIGTANIIFKKLKSNLKYKTNKNFFEFNYFDKIESSKFYFNGLFNFNPFYSSIEGKVNELNLFYLFDKNAFIAELFKTEIFNNKNINFELKINANKVFANTNFENIIFNSRINEGLIDIDNTKFKWNDYINFEISDSLIFVKNDELTLDANLQINIIDDNKFFKFLVTPKKYRKKIKKINLNLVYNFDQNTADLTEIRINDKLNKKVNIILNNLSLKLNNLHNKIYFKNLLNDALKAYEG